MTIIWRSGITLGLQGCELRIFRDVKHCADADLTQKVRFNGSDSLYFDQHLSYMYVDLSRSLGTRCSMRPKICNAILTFVTGFLIAATSAATSVYAHPHAWIDVTARVLFDKNARVVGLQQTWLFDPAYTVFATEGLDGDGDGIPDKDKLEALLRENMRNLKAYQYFTDVRYGSDRIAFSRVTDMSSRMRDRRLEMTFSLLFRTPLEAMTIPVVYAIYDPTYYIEMVHAETSTPIELVNAPAICRYRLTQPNPNPEVVSLAASLDRTQTAGDGLGRLFAESVAIECAATP